MNKRYGGQGATSAHIRRYNLRFLLQSLRHLGQASKADLARMTGLTSPAVGQIVGELEELGLIQSVGKRHDGKLGQPPTLLRVNHDGAFGIGVRLDTDRIETALVDLGGHVISRRVSDMDPRVPRPPLGVVTEDIRTLVATASRDVRRRITGIGVARPFGAAQPTRAGSSAIARWEWDGDNFVTDLSKATAMNIFDETDGTAGALAELFYGQGQTIDDFFYIFIGPSISGGLVLEGECRRGRSGYAGDVAVMPVRTSRLSSVPRPEGPNDILASRASINALLRHLRYYEVPVRGLSDLPAVMAANRVLVNDWIGDCADALVCPILSARSLLDIPLVIIDGDLPQPWLDLLIERVLRGLDAAASGHRPLPQIQAGSFGAYAGAIGAASLPLFSSTPSLRLKRG